MIVLRIMLLLIQCLFCFLRWLSCDDDMTWSGYSNETALIVAKHNRWWCSVQKYFAMFSWLLTPASARYIFIEWIHIAVIIPTSESLLLSKDFHAANTVIFFGSGLPSLFDIIIGSRTKNDLTKLFNQLIKWIKISLIMIWDADGYLWDDNWKVEFLIFNGDSNPACGAVVKWNPLKILHLI